MEGGFESGGMSSGGPVGGGQVGSSFDSGAGLGNFEAVQQTGFQDMTSMDYLQDGVDKGFYKVDTQGVFSVDEVMSEAQSEMEAEEKEEFDLMDIPGSAHEKLSFFSEMSDEELDREEATADHDNDFKKVNENVSKSSYSSEDFQNKSEDEHKLEKELSFEQKIIQIQAETIKLLAQSLNKEVNKKELEELIKKLKELVEDKNSEKDSNNSKLIKGVLSSLILLTSMAEEGIKKLENEVKEVEK